MSHAGSTLIRVSLVGFVGACSIAYVWVLSGSYANTAITAASAIIVTGMAALGHAADQRADIK